MRNFASMVAILFLFACKSENRFVEVIYVNPGSSSMFPSYCNVFPQDWSADAIDSLEIKETEILDEIIARINDLELSNDSLDLLEVDTDKKLIVRTGEGAQEICMGQFKGIIKNNRVMKNDSVLIDLINNLIIQAEE